MQTIDPFHFKHDYKIYTNSHESNAKKQLATIKVWHQSEDIKNRITLLSGV